MLVNGSAGHRRSPISKSSEEMNQYSPEGLFPAELHAKVALDCETTAAKLAEEIDSTSCPIRRARLENKQAQKIRNSIFHRALAERTSAASDRELVDS